MSHRAAITASFLTATCFCLFALMTAFSCISTEKACEGNWESSIGIPSEWELDIDKAQVELIPWTAGDEETPMIAWVSNWVCCDCGLSHRMALIPMQDGLVIYIWRLERETRQARMQRGIYRDLYRDMFAAENKAIEQ
jgi:hypothetical protein